MSTLPLRKMSAGFVIFAFLIPYFTFVDVVRAANSVLLDVPFAPQVPLGEWNDPRQKDGCEEASILMALMWATGIRMGPEEIRTYIIGMSESERNSFGFFHDTSAADTAKLMVKFFDYPHVRVEHNISVGDIKEALNGQNVAIVPLNPRVLNSRLYNRTTIYHTVVVVGYDEAKGEIIYHNPLFRSGAHMRAKESVFQKALGDYPSGRHVPTRSRPSAMIVVSKP